MKKPTTNTFEKAFTLVEIMIVVTIIAIIAAMAIPAFMKIREGVLVKAYERGEKLNPEQMKTVREYYAERKRYERADSGTKTFVVSETVSISSPTLIPADEITEVTVNGQKFYVWSKK